MQTRNLDQQVRNRLRELLKDHPQAEIARKTGFGKHNVSRYLHGTRISGEFCSAVITGLGVNPAWLMAGEGTPYLSDVTSGTANMAGNLLELVQAMSEVAKMRLGALTGRTHLKVLRQLDEALRNYESLRGQLNRQTKPFLEKLLQDYHSALQKHDVDRAAHVRRAVHQLRRMSDDELLAREADNLDAFFEFQNHRNEDALRLQRKVFLSLLGRDQPIDQRMLRDAMNHSRVLAFAGRYEESYRICGAALELGRNLQQDSLYQALRALRAWLELQLGNPGKALPLILDAMPRMDEQAAASYWGDAIFVQLMCGTLEWPAAMNVGRPGTGRVVVLVQWAFLLGEPEAIRAAHERFTSDFAKLKLAMAEPFLVRAANVLARIKQGDRHAYDAWRKQQLEPESLRTGKGVDRFNLLVQEATLALAAHDTAAKKIILQARKEWHDLPPDVQPDLQWRALHWRNLLHAEGGRELQTAAQEARGQALVLLTAGCFGLKPLLSP